MIKSSGNQNPTFNHIVGPVIGEQVIMNPTLKELHAYGATWIKKEPEYKVEFSGENFNIVEFWYKIEPFIYEGKTFDANKEIRNIRYMIGTKTKESQTGKKLFVNGNGKFTYADSLETVPEWFDKTKLREALSGEDILYDFVRALGNFKQKDSLQINRDHAVVGNFEDLKTFINDCDSSKFKVLLGLSFNEEKNRLNSVAYTKTIWRHWQETVGKPDGNGGFIDVPFNEALEAILKTDYKDFNKSVLHPTTPMILSNLEALGMADIPNKSDEINASTGNELDEELPF